MKNRKIFKIYNICLAPFRFDLKEINKFQKMIRDSDYMNNNKITESERILRKNKVTIK